VTNRFVPTTGSCRAHDRYPCSQCLADEHEAFRTTRERRERLATVALQGILASSDAWDPESAAAKAVLCADALICELDRGAQS